MNRQQFGTLLVLNLVTLGLVVVVAVKVFTQPEPVSPTTQLVRGLVTLLVGNGK